jgi:hypothetical protein
MKPRPFTFTLSFPEITLDKDQIWPDHDGPEEPTAADVVRQMATSTGGVYQVLNEWALMPDSIEVFGDHDASKATHQ